MAEPTNKTGFGAATFGGNALTSQLTIRTPSDGRQTAQDGLVVHSARTELGNEDRRKTLPGLSTQ